MAQGTAERTGSAEAAPPAEEVWSRRVAGAATALAAVLVLFQLGDKSLWFDEAYSVGIVDRPFGDALWRMANWEVNQSPFYLLFAGWWRLGSSETFLRLLPAAFAVLAIPAMYALGRRLLGAVGGAIAAVLLACHPLAIQWGQQVRGYSLVLLLVVLAALQVLRAADDPDSVGAAVGAGTLAAVATYGHFFAGLVAASWGLWLLLHRPLPLRLVVRAGVTYAVLLVPLAAFFVTRVGDPLYWLGSRSLWTSFRLSAQDLSGGTAWGAAAYGVAVVGGLWAATGAWRRDEPSRPSGVVLAALWLVGPVLAVVVSTATVKPLLEGRFLIVVLPAFIVLAAAGVARIGPTLGPIVLALVVASSALGLQRWYTALPLQDWRAAVQAIDRSVVPDADLVVEPTRAVFAIRYYEERFGLPPRDIVRDFGPPAADDLVQVRMVGNDHLAPLRPEYRAWRDELYRPRADHSVGGVDVQMFERR